VRSLDEIRRRGESDAKEIMDILRAELAAGSRRPLGFLREVIVTKLAEAGVAGWNGATCTRN
jgi:hypothetical protein